MPRGCVTKGGPGPDFAETFGAVGVATPGYRAPPVQDVGRSDATLQFGPIDTPGWTSNAGSLGPASRNGQSVGAQVQPAADAPTQIYDDDTPRSQVVRGILLSLPAVSARSPIDAKPLRTDQHAVE